MNNRIAQTFAALRKDNRKALIPYLMTGYPQRDSTVAIMHASVQAGADIIELGVPFSDPMADGYTIQQAAEQAIANGVGMAAVLETVQAFRQQDHTTPIVLMGYANSIERYNLQHGEHAFVRDAHKAGVDGMLVVDYPPESCADFAVQLKAHNMDLIFLLAPTSTPKRIQQVAQLASGYVYYVSLKGVTGSGALDTEAVAQALKPIREHVRIPVGVGFGIRDAASAQAIAQHADAVVIGSKLIELLREDTQENQQNEGKSIQKYPKLIQFLGSIRASLEA